MGTCPANRKGVLVATLNQLGIMDVTNINGAGINDHIAIKFVSEVRQVFISTTDFVTPPSNSSNF